VSVVNYDVTSSDDDLSEIKSANGPAFVYASCQLPAPCLPPEFFGQCSESDSATESDSREDMETAPDIPEPAASPSLPLAAIIPVEKPQERVDQLPHTAYRSFESSTSEEESQSAAPLAKRSKAKVMEPSSSSSSELEEEPAAKEVGGNKRRPYALKMAELPAEMHAFMAASRSFHTRAHSLERSTAGVATSTYEKAEERLLCKYLGIPRILCARS